MKTKILKIRRNKKISQYFYELELLKNVQLDENSIRICEFSWCDIEFSNVIWKHLHLINWKLFVRLRHTDTLL